MNPAAGTGRNVVGLADPVAPATAGSGSRPVVVRIIARLNIGGPARHAVILDRGLEAAGWRTLLVHGSTGPHEGSLAELARVHGVRALHVPALGRRIRPWSDLAVWYRLFRILREERPDVVHTHTAKAGTLGRLAGLFYNLLQPRERRALLVHTYHGHVFTGYFGAAASFAVRCIERILGWITDSVITISPLQREEIAGRFRIVRREKMEIVPLGLDLDGIAAGADRDEARASLDLLPTDLVVGFVGRLVPIKAPARLIDAFRQVRQEVPEARLAIVGDGELRSALERQARESGLRDSIRFHGWQHDLPRVYAAFDLLALSSENEGTPVAVIEAMAAGLPVVATRVGGVPDVVEDGTTGLLVAPGDARALAEAVVTLARDPVRRAAMGERGRCAARERYAPDRLVAEVQDVYRRGLVRRRGH